jgi:hypothetical protein
MNGDEYLTREDLIHQRDMAATLLEQKKAELRDLQVAGCLCR